MHHLDFEKIIDKLGSKYEAVVRMSVKARKFTEGDVPLDGTAKDKVSSMALNEYMKETQLEGENPAEVKE